MLSFFRRALSSWLVLGLLALLMIAFVVTGVGTPNGLGLDALGTGGGRIAKVGKVSIGEEELSRRVQQQVEAARRDDPTADVAGFLASGEFEPLVKGLISSVALEQFGRAHGIAASDRLVDGEIASIAAFRGPTGKFDPATFQRLLAQQRVSEQQLRADLAGDLIRRQLIAPVGAAPRVPAELARPYASLLLERRAGTIGLVPISAMPASPAPSPAEINAYYARNLARFTLPERRVIRYALFGTANARPVAPTDAEIAAYYRSNAAAYGPKETRTLSQIVLSDEAAARAFVAKVRGGTSFDEAAKAAGFGTSDTALGKQTRAQIAEIATPAAADAAFALKEGGVTDPQKSPLGWHVIRADKVETEPARSLDQVHDEIVATLTRQKSAEAITDLIQTIEDEVAGGATFDEVVKKHGLTGVTTPRITAAGAAPDQPGWSLPPQLQPLVKTAFDASPDDDASVETLNANGNYALLDVAEVVPSAPLPLAQARPLVVQQIAADRAFARAEQIAKQIAAKAQKGISLAKAVAEAGVRLPEPQPAGGRQGDLGRDGQPVPPPLRMMFSMTQGSTRILPAPGRQGWFVVHLDTIERQDAAAIPGLVAGTQGQLARLLGAEYIEQFAGAVARSIGVQRDDAAIARVKASLASGNAR